MNIKTLSHSTPISIALVIAICIGAFTTGTISQKMQMRVDVLESTQQDHKQLIRRIVDLSADNKHRIDLFEANLNRTH